MTIFNSDYWCSAIVVMGLLLMAIKIAWRLVFQRNLSKKRKQKLQDQCEICLPVCHRVGIARPADLQKFIPSIRSLWMKGNLIEIRDKLEISRFATFQEYGPWEDYIHHEFECSHCGRRFLLSVETYHGVGGEWEPIEDNI